MCLLLCITRCDILNKVDVMLSMPYEFRNIISIMTMFKLNVREDGRYVRSVDQWLTVINVSNVVNK